MLNPPWRLTDVQALAALCEEAGQLHPGVAAPVVDLLAPVPGSFPGIESAFDALERNPIYQWLEHELPYAMELAKGLAPAQRFRFVVILVRWIVIALAKVGRLGPTPRSDRKRKIAKKYINRVEGFLSDGTIRLAESDGETLRRLLGEAREQMTVRRRPGATYWELSALALDLQRNFRIADARIILDVATVTKLDCDERTAQRLVRKARLEG